MQMIDYNLLFTNIDDKNKIELIPMTDYQNFGKVSIVGSSGVGKTSIFQMFIGNQINDVELTIAAAFFRCYRTFSTRIFHVNIDSQSVECQSPNNGNSCRYFSKKSKFNKNSKFDSDEDIDCVFDFDELDNLNFENVTDHNKNIVDLNYTKNVRIS